MVIQEEASIRQVGYKKKFYDGSFKIAAEEIAIILCNRGGSG